jgi:acetyl esterase
VRGARACAWFDSSRLVESRRRGERLLSTHMRRRGAGTSENAEMASVVQVPGQVGTMTESTEVQPLIKADSGISPAQVYSDGGLDQGRSMYPIGRTLAFLFFTAFMLAPAAIAFKAGAANPHLLEGGKGDDFSLLVGAAATALFVIMSMWICCCGCESGLKLYTLYLGGIFRIMFNRLTRFSDFSAPDHVQKVTAQVKTLNNLLGMAVKWKFSGLMKQHGVSLTEMSFPRTRNSAAGDMKVRVYRPSVPDDSEKLPVILFFHGGGWVVMGHDGLHDLYCIEIAARSKAVVVFPDYLKAPKHKFPAAPDDCLDVLEYVVGAGAETLQVDASRVAVAGDSAGGNLSAVIAQDASAAGIELKHQLLIYPVTSARVHWFSSWTENTTQPVLTAEVMLWFWREYLAKYEDSTHPRAAPLEATSCRGLCPATVITAQFDPLRDEGIAYGKKLEADGVDVTFRHYPNTVHGFFGASMAGPQLSMPHDMDALRFGAEQLAKALHEQ